MNYGQLLNLLMDIIRFKAGPQDLPASPSLLITLVLASSVISLVGFSHMGPMATSMAQIAIAAGFALVFIGVILQFRGGPSRFLQTAAALFGTDTLLTAAALPATLGMNPTAEEISGLAIAWLLLVLLWTVAVLSHIFRHAMDLPTSGGAMIAVLYLFLSLNVTSALA